MDLTGELASIVMLIWDSKFLKKCSKIGIQIPMYDRYVDDTLNVLPAIRHQWEYCSVNNEKVYKSVNAVNNENDRDSQAHTMKILTSVANSITPEIRMEADYPSKHNDNRLPFLDLAIWMDGKKVRHSFFRKDMATPFLILKRSAMSMATKRESLLQEGLRRLRNMDCSISIDERNKVMSTFSNAMRISGYNWEYRFNMIKGITQRYQECERLISEGSRVRYRTGAQILEQKQNRNGKSINTWFLKGEFTNVLKVQCTPEGRLREVVQKTRFQWQ